MSPTLIGAMIRVQLMIAVEALERASPNLDLFNGSLNSTRRMLTVSRHRPDLG